MGGMTEILNWREVCQQLNVTEESLRKYIIKKIGCPIDSKGIIKGRKTAQDIDTVIQDFIEKYILCRQCKLPELSTDLICKACGFNNKK
jgi:translation initiation factor 2 beta subunit (eIF-2beta)/eIF-5